MDVGMAKQEAPIEKAGESAAARGASVGFGVYDRHVAWRLAGWW
jgi:hypothetical protein